MILAGIIIVAIARRNDLKRIVERLPRNGQGLGKYRHLAGSCLTQVAIIAAIAVLFCRVTELDRTTSAIVASTVWTLILCFTPAFGMWFIQPHENTAVVLASALAFKTALSTEAELTRIQKTRTMRVIYGPTFDGKAPWEEIVNDRVVNLLRSIVLDKNELNVVTRDNVKCVVKWMMTLQVILSDECIMNLVRNSEEKIIATFKAKAEAYIEATVRTMSVEELFEQVYTDPDTNREITVGQARLSKGFEGLYWGDDRIHPTEKEMGMQSKNLTISQVLPDEAYQKAMQSKATAIKVSEALKLYKDLMSQDVAANLNAIDRGLTPPSTIIRHIVSGLEKGAHLVVGDLQTKK